MMLSRVISEAAFFRGAALFATGSRISPVSRKQAIRSVSSCFPPETGRWLARQKASSAFLADYGYLLMGIGLAITGLIYYLTVREPETGTTEK